MQQNIIWTNFLKRMNKVKLFILVTVIGGLLTSCCLCEDCCNGLREYETSATIYLVNETSGVVKSSRTFDYEIQPGQTVVHKEAYTGEHTEKPTTENYRPFYSTRYLFFYDESKCETGLRDIENYENRKEVSPLVFEFTFRFTEEKKAKAKTYKNHPQNPFNQ